MGSRTELPGNNRVFLMVAALGLLVMACDSTNSAPETTEMVGKWDYLQANFDIEDKTTPPSLLFPDSKTDTLMDLTGQGYFLDLKANGTFTAEVPTIDFNLEKTASGSEVELDAGSWSHTGSKLALNFPDGEPIELAIQFTGGDMVLTSIVDNTYTDEGYTFTSKGTIVFKLKKP